MQYVASLCDDLGLRAAHCVHVRVICVRAAGELEANLALGVVYEELHEAAAAIQCHERRLELASQHNLQVRPMATTQYVYSAVAAAPCAGQPAQPAGVAMMHFTHILRILATVSSAAMHLTRTHTRKGVRTVHS